MGEHTQEYEKERDEALTALLAVEGEIAELHKQIQAKQEERARPQLSSPILRDIAILSLRYPISRETFSVGLHLCQKGAIPSPLGTFIYTDISVRNAILQHIGRYLRDTQYCPHAKNYRTDFYMFGKYCCKKLQD